LSEDPSCWPDDRNLYRYVKNNPVNERDPSGHAIYVRDADNGYKAAEKLISVLGQFGPQAIALTLNSSGEDAFKGMSLLAFDAASVAFMKKALEGRKAEAGSSLESLLKASQNQYDVFIRLSSTGDLEVSGQFSADDVLKRYNLHYWYDKAEYVPVVSIVAGIGNAAVYAKEGNIAGVVRSSINAIPLGKRGTELVMPFVAPGLQAAKKAATVLPKTAAELALEAAVQILKKKWADKLKEKTKEDKDQEDKDKCGFVFFVDLLPAPNPNALRSVKVSGNPTNGVGVYVKKHFKLLKVGSAGGTTTFRTRYTLSNPEGGCNIWYELAQTKNAKPPGVDDSEYPWNDKRQRRFDEEYVDRLIPAAMRFRSPRGDDPVDDAKWKAFKHIFGYGDMPVDFGP
jgi:hypothetical protein